MAAWRIGCDHPGTPLGFMPKLLTTKLFTYIVYQKHVLFQTEVSKNHLHLFCCLEVVICAPFVLDLTNVSNMKNKQSYNKRCMMNSKHSCALPSAINIMAINWYFDYDKLIWICSLIHLQWYIRVSTWRIETCYYSTSVSGSMDSWANL